MGTAASRNSHQLALLLILLDEETREQVAKRRCLSLTRLVEDAKVEEEDLSSMGECVLLCLCDVSSTLTELCLLQRRRVTVSVWARR